MNGAVWNNRQYQRTPLFTRLMQRVVPGPGGCMLWTGGLSRSDPGQYGCIKTAERKVVRVHRVAWEHEHGPIPEGYDVDHLCGVKVCVNVQHLQILTVSEHRRLTHARRRT